jgi:hypothetical protein
MQVPHIHIQGLFDFWSDSDGNFKGPIKKGFRFIAWGKSKKKTTSASVVSNNEIKLGEVADVEIVLLNELSVDIKIEKGAVLSVGSTAYKIGEFTISKIIGYWNQKVP